MTLTATKYVIQMTTGNVEQNQKVILAAQTGYRSFQPDCSQHSAVIQIRILQCVDFANILLLQ